MIFCNMTVLLIFLFHIIVKCFCYYNSYQIDVAILYLNLCCFSGHGNLLLGSVDSYGHLIVSKLDASGKGIFPCVLKFSLT